jgi:hypothetical protein
MIELGSRAEITRLVDAREENTNTNGIDGILGVPASASNKRTRQVLLVGLDDIGKNDSFYPPKVKE